MPMRLYSSSAYAAMRCSSESFTENAITFLCRASRRWEARARRKRGSLENAREVDLWALSCYRLAVERWCSMFEAQVHKSWCPPRDGDMSAHARMCRAHYYIFMPCHYALLVSLRRSCCLFVEVADMLAMFMIYLCAPLIAAYYLPCATTLYTMFFYPLSVAVYVVTARRFAYYAPACHLTRLACWSYVCAVVLRHYVDAYVSYMLRATRDVFTRYLPAELLLFRCRRPFYCFHVTLPARGLCRLPLFSRPDSFHMLDDDYIFAYASLMPLFSWYVFCFHALFADFAITLIYYAFRVFRWYTRFSRRYALLSHAIAVAYLIFMMLAPFVSLYARWYARLPLSRLMMPCFVFYAMSVYICSCLDVCFHARFRLFSPRLMLPIFADDYHFIVYAIRHGAYILLFPRHAARLYFFFFRCYAGCYFFFLLTLMTLCLPRYISCCLLAFSMPIRCSCFARLLRHLLFRLMLLIDASCLLLMSMTRHFCFMTYFIWCALLMLSRLFRCCVPRLSLCWSSCSRCLFRAVHMQRFTRAHVVAAVVIGVECALFYDAHAAMHYGAMFCRPRCYVDMPSLISLLLAIYRRERCLRFLISMPWYYMFIPPWGHFASLAIIWCCRAMRAIMRPAFPLSLFLFAFHTLPAACCFCFFVSIAYFFFFFFQLSLFRRLPPFRRLLLFHAACSLPSCHSSYSSSICSWFSLRAHARALLLFAFLLLICCLPDYIFLLTLLRSFWYATLFIRYWLPSFVVTLY